MYDMVFQQPCLAEEVENGFMAPKERNHTSVRPILDSPRASPVARSTSFMFDEDWSSAFTRDITLSIDRLLKPQCQDERSAMSTPNDFFGEHQPWQGALSTSQHTSYGSQDPSISNEQSSGEASPGSFTSSRCSNYSASPDLVPISASHGRRFMMPHSDGSPYDLRPNTIYDLFEPEPYESRHPMNSHPEARAKAFAGHIFQSIDPQKYKTRMCRNWQIRQCPFGDACAYAHGAKELRAENVNAAVVNSLSKLAEQLSKQNKRNRNRRTHQ
mmetsp:Transcript_125197/g.216963  ORF Transcript_125197/g.216963 Transcript_125197/m.216963 type:complete len:271 (-) Transcript_125197:1206-2018(-)